ncbi:hypothetical protein [Spirosoma arcticum]
MGLKFGHLIFVLTLFASCRHEPQPFQASLAGYSIQFPTTSKELRNRYPNAVETLLIFLKDTTQNVQVVWRFENSIRDPRSQPYGVSVTLKNKGHKMDSIRTALETQYAQSFEPLTRPQHLGEYEYHEQDSSLGVMQINDDVQLSINRRKVWPQGGYKFTNDVVVSICYNLDVTERERFAMKQGDIRNRD